MAKRAKKRHKNDLGQVRACDCGGANLSLGPMTLHLSAEEVGWLHELTAAALGFGRDNHTGHTHAGALDPASEDTVH